MEHSKDYPQDVTSEKEIDPTSDDKEPTSVSDDKEPTSVSDDKEPTSVSGRKVTFSSERTVTIDTEGRTMVIGVEGNVGTLNFRDVHATFTAVETESSALGEREATSDGGKASISKDEVTKTGKASAAAMEEQEVETYVRNGFSCDYIVHDLRSTILVEMLNKDYKLVELLSHFGVLDLWTVVHKRLVPDPHRESHKRALVVFSSQENARKAFQTINSSQGNFCSVIVHDVISGIKRLEQTLRGFNFDFQQEKEVLVSKLPPDQKDSEVKKLLFKYFSKAGVVKRIIVPTAPDGCAQEAFIKYSSLSEAFLAELAFDDMLINGQKLRVALVGNTAFQQFSLFSKLGHSIVECNENFEKTELWKQFSKIKFRPGCSYLECRKCYSRDQEVLLHYPETNIPKDNNNAEKTSASSDKE